MIKTVLRCIELRWEDLRTRDAFGEFEIGDDWNNHFGASSTFAGDLTSVTFLQISKALLSVKYTGV